MPKGRGFRDDMSGAARARRRGAGMVLVRPPAAELALANWHILTTPQGDVLAQWRPGVERWMVGNLETIPAERAGAMGWCYGRAWTAP